MGQPPLEKAIGRLSQERPTQQGCLSKRGCRVLFVNHGAIRECLLGKENEAWRSIKFRFKPCSMVG
jgi:hypothetical protein